VFLIGHRGPGRDAGNLARFDPCQNDFRSMIWMDLFLALVAQTDVPCHGLSFVS